MSPSSWKQFLSDHPDNPDYDKASKEIANIAGKLDKPKEIFNLLQDAPNLILASRSAVDNTIQALFHFHSKGKRFLKSQIRHYALHGFGACASPIRLTNDNTFRASSTDRPVPSFVDLFTIDSPEKVKFLTPNPSWKKKKVPSFAILVPSLAKIVIKFPEAGPAEILFEIVTLLRSNTSIEDSLDSTVPDSNTSPPGSPSQDSTNDNGSADDTSDEDYVDVDSSPSKKRRKAGHQKTAKDSKNPTSNSKSSSKCSKESSTTKTKTSPPIPKLVIKESHVFGTLDQNDLEEAFHNILTFFWAWAHNEKVVRSIPIAPKTSEQMVSYFKKVHADCLDKSLLSPDPKDAQLMAMAAAQHTSAHPPLSSSEAQEGLMTCITSFGDALEQNTEVRKQERKERELEGEEKAWKQLTPLSCRVIESMQIRHARVLDFSSDKDLEDSDGFIIPTGPTEDMKAIINSKTGACAQQHLQHILTSVHKCIVCLQPGMCTLIKNGLLLSQPTPYDANNFSPYFLPPSSKEDSMSAADHQRLEEQAENGKLNEADLELVTKQTVAYPTNYNDLRHFAKNTLCTLIVLAGELAILTKSSKEVYDHIIEYESAYVYQLASIPQFGAYFISKLHEGIQVFLHSCGSRDSKKIDFAAIDFSSLLKSIQRQDIQFIRLPKYIKKVSFKEQEDTKDNNPSKNKNKQQQRRGNGGNNDSPRPNLVKLTNPDTDPECLLPPDLEYKRAFSRKLKTGIPPPKSDDGVEMCHKFHAKGFCLSKNCPFSQTQKNPAEKLRWKKFKDAVIERYRQRVAGTNNNNNNN